ncbi:hypothetical protein [Nesterenkonia rhizosphaerae]|uniref:Gram-positive cocci surface proteins LPxTG domain-containing protein n=1 Tax=Nesterenkonia rhizosphaerae TaxID=1348272 RepID=A0ABP9G020_9MICC
MRNIFAALLIIPLLAAPSAQTPLSTEVIENDNVRVVSTTSPELFSNLNPSMTAEWDISVETFGVVGRVDLGVEFDGDKPLDIAMALCPGDFPAAPNASPARIQDAEKTAVSSCSDGVYVPVASHVQHQQNTHLSFDPTSGPHTLRLWVTPGADAHQGQTTRATVHIEGTGDAIAVVPPSQPASPEDAPAPTPRSSGTVHAPSGSADARSASPSGPGTTPEGDNSPVAAPTDNIPPTGATTLVLAGLALILILLGVAAVSRARRAKRTRAT